MIFNALSCCNSISKFSSLKNVFAASTSLSEISVRHRQFTSLVQPKEMISISYDKDGTWPHIYHEGHMQQFQPGSNHKIWKQQQKYRTEIYPPTKHLYVITKFIPISTRTITSGVMTRSIHFWIWRKTNIK